MKAGRAASTRMGLLAVALLAVVVGFAARAEITHSTHSTIAHSARAAQAVLAPANNYARPQTPAGLDLVGSTELRVPTVTAGEQVRPAGSATQSSTPRVERGRDPPGGGVRF